VHTPIQTGTHMTDDVIRLMEGEGAGEGVVVIIYKWQNLLGYQ